MAAYAGLERLGLHRGTRIPSVSMSQLKDEFGVPVSQTTISRLTHPLVTSGRCLPGPADHLLLEFVVDGTHVFVQGELKSVNGDMCLVDCAASTGRPPAILPRVGAKTDLYGTF